MLRIGTRGSQLALWQAHFLQDQLRAIGQESELVIIKTQGDRVQDLSFEKLEGKGFFTKEIEDALLRGDIDMAVHSMKDLPTHQPDGLAVTAVSYRDNPADWLLIRKEAFVTDMPLRVKTGAIVGTSAARRKAIALSFRPDIEMRDIRGNVPTRIDKLRKGDFDAIFLAAAGISRLKLDLTGLEVLELSPREFVPAPAQGVLAYQVVESDVRVRRILQAIHQPDVSAVTNVERTVLKKLGGGCHTPLGVYCERDAAENYHVWAVCADAWDAPLRRVRLSSSTTFGLADDVLAKLRVG